MAREAWQSKGRGFISRKRGRRSDLVGERPHWEYFYKDTGFCPMCSKSELHYFEDIYGTPLKDCPECNVTFLVEDDGTISLMSSQDEGSRF